MTVLLVASDHGDSDTERAQRWVDELQARGHDVYLVAPLSVEVDAAHHVVTRGGTVDALRAIADAVEGVEKPVTVLAAEARGSVVTVEEVVSRPGTNVLCGPMGDPKSPAIAGASSQLRVVAGVVMEAGSSVHAISETTDRGLGVLCVDDADVEAVAGSLRVMADVADSQRWECETWPLTVVAAVRGGTAVTGAPAPGLPWGGHGAVLEHDEEVSVRIQAAADPPQGVVDRIVGRSAAEWVSAQAWRIGVGAHSATAVSLATALMAGLLISTGTRTGSVVAAIFLLVSVLLGRVDGILARARRTVTPFGAWLDVTTDRLREAALVIGLAVGAAASGDPVWGLAAAVLVMVTIAQLAAAASRTACGWGGRPVPPRIPLDRLEEPVLRPLQRPPGRPVPQWLPFSVSRGDGVAIVVVGLVALQPKPLLAVLAVVSGLSAIACLVQIGAPRPLAAAQRQLFELSDPGPLARLIGRQDPQLSLLRRVLSTGAAAWIPPATWVLESSAVLVAAVVAAPEAIPVTIAWLAVMGFHRIDVGTRQRVLGESPPSWLGVIGAGAIGRAILVVVLAALGVLAWGLAVGAIVFAVVYAAESASQFSKR